MRGCGWACLVSVPTTMFDRRGTPSAREEAGVAPSQGAIGTHPEVPGRARLGLRQGRGLRGCKRIGPGFHRSRWNNRLWRCPLLGYGVGPTVRRVSSGSPPVPEGWILHAAAKHPRRTPAVCIESPSKRWFHRALFRRSRVGRTLRANERKPSFVRKIARKRRARRSKMRQTVVCTQICVLPTIAHNSMLAKSNKSCKATVHEYRRKAYSSSINKPKHPKEM